MGQHVRPLKKWMNFILRFAAIYNLCAGLLMVFFTRVTYWLIGMHPPELDFPMQLVGILVALFGVGYYLVAKNPIENRHLLTLGCFSKGLGSLLGLWYMILGELPWRFLPVLFVSDIAYLFPFAIIIRRLSRLSAERR